MKTVAEAKEATEAAQESVAKVQAQLRLDDDKTVEEMSKKSLKISKDIEDQSREMFERGKKNYFSHKDRYYCVFLLQKLTSETPWKWNVIE